MVALDIISCTWYNQLFKIRSSLCNWAGQYLPKHSFLWQGSIKENDSFVVINKTLNEYTRVVCTINVLEASPLVNFRIRVVDIMQRIEMYHAIRNNNILSHIGTLHINFDACYWILDLGNNLYFAMEFESVLAFQKFTGSLLYSKWRPPLIW